MVSESLSDSSGEQCSQLEIPGQDNLENIENKGVEKLVTSPNQDFGQKILEIVGATDNTEQSKEALGEKTSLFDTAESLAERQEKLKKGIKIVIGGPPHSGKSVFIEALMQNLDKNNTFSFSAAPDGEGPWLQRHYDDPEVVKLRQKGKFTPEFVADRRRKIHDWDGPLMVIDIGGRTSEENAQMIEGATHAIILAGDLSKVEEWRDFFEENNIDVIAKLHSHYHGNHEVQRPMEQEKNHIVSSVHHLERGEPAVDRATIKQVAGLITGLVDGNTAYKTAHEGDNSNPFELFIPEVFKDLPSEIIERTITTRDGQQKQVQNKQILRSAIPKIYEKALDFDGQPAWLNGPIPSWEAIALALAFENAGSSNVRLRGPDGYISVKTLPEDGELDTRWWDEPELQGKMDGMPVYKIHNTAHTSSNPISPTDLDTMTIPNLPEDAIVIISTQGPNWLKASIASGYKGKVAGIAAFQPGEGSTIAWSNNPELLGAIVEERTENVMPQPEQKELIRTGNHMKYGSERFENVTANNHNEVRFEDIGDANKLVFGKDVVLVLPSNPDRLDIRAGYPTHQESWLPLWYVILNHSQAMTEQELDYQRKVAEKVTPEDYERANKAVIHKSLEFFEAFKNQQGLDDNPRKKYKNLTRILQDSLLYVGRTPGVIENQQVFLENSPLYPLIELANKLRRGEELDRAGELEVKVGELLKAYTDEYGGVDELRKGYTELRSEISEHSGDQRVILFPDKALKDADFYTKLTSSDLLMSRDDHDEDIVSIVPQLESPNFYQVDELLGANLAHQRRTDIIAVPANLQVWDTVKNGKESYQPISMIIASHTKPESESGKELQARLQSELSPDLIAHHYLGASEEFLHKEAWGKSYARRIDREDIPQIKKVIPLYRVATDLLPRAVYMLKTGKYPTSVDDEEMWHVGETEDLVETIRDMFARQDASQEELRALYEKVNDRFNNWYKPEDYEVFRRDMEIMKNQGE